MTCKECRKAKPFAAGSMYCLLYGIIIREDHEGEREGCMQHDADDGGSYADNPATGLQEERWDDIDSLQGLLSEA